MNDNNNNDADNNNNSDYNNDTDNIGHSFIFSKRLMFHFLFNFIALRTSQLVMNLFLFPFPLFGPSSQSLFLSSFLYSLHDLSFSLPWGTFEVPSSFRFLVSTNDPAFFKGLESFSRSILPSLSLFLLDLSINFRCLGIAPDATSAVEIEYINIFNFEARRLRLSFHATRDDTSPFFYKSNTGKYIKLDK